MKCPSLPISYCRTETASYNSIESAAFLLRRMNAEPDAGTGLSQKTDFHRQSLTWKWPHPLVSSVLYVAIEFIPKCRVFCLPQESGVKIPPSWYGQLIAVTT